MKKNKVRKETDKKDSGDAAGDYGVDWCSDRRDRFDYFCFLGRRCRTYAEPDVQISYWSSFLGIDVPELVSDGGSTSVCKKHKGKTG